MVGGVAQATVRIGNVEADHRLRVSDYFFQ